MTKGTKRRLVALLSPLPIIAAGAMYLRYGRPTGGIEMALKFPYVCVWYLGLKSVGAAAAVGLGYWYLLLAMIGHAALCGRDRVSKALFVCVVATSLLVGAVLLLLRGFDGG